MKRSTSLMSALVVLALLVTACGSTTAGTAAKAATTPASSSSCSFPSFTATVRHGPDVGLSIQGKLTLQVDGTGSVTGSLKQTSGPHVLSVVGQANGRAINLVFDLGNHRLLFGVGTLQEPLRACKGAAGGPFVGPRDGDSGDWGTPSKPGGSGD